MCREIIFCAFNACRGSIAIVFSVSVLLAPYALWDFFLYLGGSTFTIVFSNFSISYISLLLFLGSSSNRNSGSGCLVSYLLMLLIVLTWCPIFARSSLIFPVFVFWCNPLITAF